MGANDAIKVEFDPEQPYGQRRVGSDEDGPIFEPMTLLDAVVERCADLVLSKIHDGNEQRTRLQQLVEERLLARAEELLEEQLPKIINEALSGEFTVTSEFGHERWKGSLREALAAHAGKQLAVNARGNRGMLGNETVLEKVIKDEIDYALSTELREAVKGAKGELVKRLREITGDTLAKTVVDGLLKR